MPRKVSRFERRTARHVLSLGQSVLLVLALGAIGYALDTARHAAILGYIAFAMVFYAVFVGFRIVLWGSAERYRYADLSRPLPLLALINREIEMPTYTIFLPLYREGKKLIELVNAIDNLDYPKDKLQVLLLLEHDDDETWTALGDLVLPSYFEAVAIPPGGPRTKPNALNFGLARATGDYCVIFDAEDRPESDQLQKSIKTFRRMSSNVVCLQARLAFRNGTTNWVTRFFWAEYITHFEWVLAGLVRWGIVPPLGGTSNHFVTKRLREVAIGSERLPFIDGYIGGWDPYNVTEDAELAAALAANGYRVAMLDSTTWEEAPTKIWGKGRADRQRRRWLKGYAQTGLVYTRRPLRTIRQMGLKNWFFFNLLMLGTPLSQLINPFFWGATITYFVTRTTVIEQLFPLPLYYGGLLLMVTGNLVLFYQQVAACLKREGYGNVKYMLLIPLWWLFTSCSAWMMLYELITRPHYWHKTEHDLGSEKEELNPSQQGIAVVELMGKSVPVAHEATETPAGEV